MINFTTYTKENAPEGSREILSNVLERMKFIPNLMGKMAESPVALQAYLSLSELLKNSSFTSAQQQIIMLVISLENGCTYCVAAHSMSAKHANVTDDIIEALRQGQHLQDAKLEGLRQFVQAVVRDRGMLKEDRLQAFIDLGYSKANILDVILAAAMKTISNYANHIMHPELDSSMQAYKWERLKLYPSCL